jgi:hypothetical protein
MRALIEGVASVRHPIIAADEVLDETVHLLDMLFSSTEKPVGKASPGAANIKKAADLLGKNKTYRLSLIAFTFLSRVGKLVDPLDYQNNGISLIDEWKASQSIEAAVLEMGVSPEDSVRIVKLVRVLVTLQEWIKEPLNQKPETFVQEALSDIDIQLLIQVNRYKDILWYSKEGFDDLLNCMLLSVVFNPADADPSIRFEEIIQAREIIDSLTEAGENSGFQIEKLIQLLEESPAQAA